MFSRKVFPRKDAPQSPYVSSLVHCCNLKFCRHYDANQNHGRPHFLLLVQTCDKKYDLSNSGFKLVYSAQEQPASTVAKEQVPHLFAEYFKFLKQLRN